MDWKKVVPIKPVDPADFCGTPKLGEPYVPEDPPDENLEAIRRIVTGLPPKDGGKKP